MIRCMVDVWKREGVDDSIKMPRYEGLVLSYDQPFAIPYISSPLTTLSQPSGSTLELDHIFATQTQRNPPTYLSLILSVKQAAQPHAASKISL